VNRVWPEETLDKKHEPCVVCGNHPVELAHVSKRAFDRPRRAGSKTVYVEKESIVSLCPDCHRSYDAHELDLIAYLPIQKQLRAVEDYGSITKALERLAPSLSRRINDFEAAA
jgi:hypothetical protein